MHRACVGRGGAGAVPGGDRMTAGTNISVPTHGAAFAPAALEPALDLLGGALQPFAHGSSSSKERADVVSSPTNCSWWLEIIQILFIKRSDRLHWVQALPFAGGIVSTGDLRV